MKVCELIDKYPFKTLSEGDLDRSISNVYSCDLLSWVMAKGKNDTAWVTVQTHSNILAVASLLDFSCVIIPEGIKVEPEIIDKAKEQDITILSTDLETFEIFKIMYEAGIR